MKRELRRVEEDGRMDGREKGWEEERIKGELEVKE